MDRANRDFHNFKKSLIIKNTVIAEQLEIQFSTINNCTQWAIDSASFKKFRAVRTPFRVWTPFRIQTPTTGGSLCLALQQSCTQDKNHYIGDITELFFTDF